MKSPLKLALFLFAFSVIVVSCGKDEDEDPIVPNNTDLLTAHEWIMTNLTLAFPLNGLNVWDSIPACERDDVFKFNTNSTGYFDEGVSKCDPSDLQIETFAWKWTNNETTIEIPEDSNEVTILSNVVVTATTLTAQTEYEEQGLTVTANLTFSTH